MWIVGFMACWVAWAYPFLFRAPLRQKRPSVTRVRATRVGIFLEGAAIFLAFLLRLPEAAPSPGRTVPAFVCGIAAASLSWSAVRHLGKQFRIHAGLYADHELVRTGPYTIVRHPIYLSLLLILVCTILLLRTPWEWAGASLLLFITGTEIRIRAEERLLASRFGSDFEEYRRQVPAYIPFVR